MMRTVSSPAYSFAMIGTLIGTLIVTSVFSFRAQAQELPIETEMVIDEEERELAIRILSEDIRLNEERTETTEAIMDEIRDDVIPLAVTTSESPGRSKRPGVFSITWGYHKGWITQSDVRFSRPGFYDFVAYGVKAEDSPGMDAAIPKRGESYQFDVPQYQVSFRYTLPAHADRKTRIGFKLQQIHSKYLPVRDENERFEKGQDVPVKGVYFDGEYRDGIGKVGTYNTSYWEYTDGLNEMTAGVYGERTLFRTKRFEATVTTGLNAGFILPATHSVTQGKKRDHHFDISGFVASADGAIKLVAWNRIFLEGMATGSYVNVTNGRLADGGKIEQKFGHFKGSVNLGYQFRLHSRKSR